MATFRTPSAQGTEAGLTDTEDRLTDTEAIMEAVAQGNDVAGIFFGHVSAERRRARIGLERRGGTCVRASELGHLSLAGTLQRLLLPRQLDNFVLWQTLYGGRLQSRTGVKNAQDLSPGSGS